MAQVNRKVSLEALAAKDQLPAPEYDPGSEHPTPEQLLVREAAKHLTEKQRVVWELHIYDKLSERKIAARLGKSRTTIATQIRQCEARIEKWCKANMSAYRLIKQEMSRE